MHLLADQRADRRAARPCRSPPGARRARCAQRPLERRQHLVRRGRLELAAVKAGALARVTGGAGGLDQRQQRVAVAVEAQRAHRLDVAAGFALVPRLARASGCTGAARRVARVRASASRVHVGERQHLAACASPAPRTARARARRRRAAPRSDCAVRRRVICANCRSSPIGDDCHDGIAAQRRLLVVTGKGGVGKTHDRRRARAAGGRRARPAHDRGRGRRPAPAAGAVRASPRTADRGAETELAASGLWSISIDPDRALLEWLQTLGGRVPGRVLASSGTFQYFAAAAPGAKELVSMVKIWELTRSERWRRRAQRYDLVVLDAPGHRSCAGPAALAADVRRDRTRRSDRRPGRAGARAAGGSRAAPAISRSRSRPRWRSPRRSSCRTSCAAQLGRELEAVDRQRDAAADASPPPSWRRSSA